MRALVASSWLLVWVLTGCTGEDRPAFYRNTGGGGEGGTAGSSSGGSGGSGASTVGGSGGQGGSGGSGGTLQAACDAPSVAPSGGSCVTITDEVECNPVTSEPCSEVCSTYGLGLFQCYTVSSQEPLCSDCSQAPCAATLDCADELGFEGVNQCARYCCDDGDCGNGICVKDGIATADAEVGLCLTAAP